VDVSVGAISKISNFDQNSITIIQAQQIVEIYENNIEETGGSPSFFLSLSLIYLSVRFRLSLNMGGFIFVGSSSRI